MKIRLRHATSGMVKECKVGFSWTTLFFGIFVPLVRGDIKWMLVMLVVGILTFSLSWLVFPFVYNKIYIKALLEKGYVPDQDSDRVVLQSRGIISGQGGQSTPQQQTTPSTSETSQAGEKTTE